MKNMRGIVDPWTLGFIISLFAGGSSYIAHQAGEQYTVASSNSHNLIEPMNMVATNKAKEVLPER